ncbi:MAG TPA: sodium/proton-translocating pyrophosphatase, partial [Kofleriaceae bacterium]|nr:sodium/proton-translocating pyrophosphatase [Kofleriaceae bacterium]
MLLLAAGSALVALAIAIVQAVAVLRRDAGTARMREVADAIREGAAAFLRREYSVIAVVAAVVAASIAVAFSISGRGLELAASFALGAVGTGLAALLGVVVSVRA